jgi:ubiquinone/menaquinone biosynthesis C-methylase UbiE
MTSQTKLRLYPLSDFARDNPSDPIRYYFWPVIGPLYRRRVELCLAECRGGERVLEVGFGIGLTFQNLAGMYQEVYGIDLYSNIEEVSRFFEEKGIQTHLRNGNVLQMPYPDSMFDTVLLVSILEHLKPEEQPIAMSEIKRVLKPSGQLVYGVPVERPLMTFLFRLMGYDIRKLHFSTEKDVSQAAELVLRKVKLIDMKNPFLRLGSIYQIGHYQNSPA